MSRLRMAIAVVITAVWTAAAISALANPQLVGLVTVITPVMLAVVSWLFTAELLARRNGIDRRGDERE